MPRLRLLLLIPSILALTGCVAAAVPVLAGGAMAHSMTRKGNKAEARKEQPAPPAPARQVAAPTPPPILPAGAGQEVGRVYQGSLPPPGPASSAAPTVMPPVPSASRWSDVGHHVAADLSPEHSVLLARGSGADEPRWVACAGKPLAVLAAASTLLAPGGGPARAIDPAAASWLGALRVLSVAMVIVAGDAAERDAVTAAFRQADLSAPIDGDTLLVGSADRMPATRAAVGERYCVLAIGGRSPADFPLGLTPDTTPPSLRELWGRGWFLLPAAVR